MSSWNVSGAFSDENHTNKIFSEKITNYNLDSGIIFARTG
jgi:hypothetical protein